MAKRKSSSFDRDPHPTLVSFTRILEFEACRNYSEVAIWSRGHTVGHLRKEELACRFYRLENTKWTLEVVDAEGTSTVWDDEFDTDDDAYAECNRTTAAGMLEFQPTASKLKS